MTTPNIPEAPDDAFVVGSDYGSNLTESSIMAIATGGAKGSFTGVQGAVGSQLRTPIADAAYLAATAQGTADEAVTTAQEAANTAAAAEEKADIAYDNASFWSNEFVVSSAAVVLGVNELLLGPVLTVPDGLEAIISDIHFALYTQPAGMTIQTLKWNAAGTSATVIHTATLGANVTRINYNALNIPILDKERVYCNVTSVTGTIAPTVLQMAVAGAILL